ncbi:hypothetical protein [Curvivirga aplysinae]|uniref:hypothetical protein n=1 Tax=Curvivirga aplysinae TaxID=2529852 RepID=UPI0012BC4B05|nr:hypothetical protein [Curvivirga aplysinae]MTI10174.1 hypothetical protein [Curvivirga aplysinae]
MKYLLSIFLIAGLAACQKTTGSMSDYDISQETLMAAYDSDFSRKEDRIGWSQDVQLAWSRGALAKACGLEFDKDSYLSKLEKEFPEIDRFTHEYNGVEFYANYFKKYAAGFCTKERMDEAQTYL